MGFIYNGITSQSMKVKARLTDWTCVPPLRNSFVEIPDKAGVADFGSTGAERIITVRCNIYPQYRFSTLVGILDDIAEWLSPDNGLKRLVLDDVSDRYFMARITDAVDCERLVMSAGAFDLKFVCPDPYGYAITDETYTITDTGVNSLVRQKGNTDSLPVYRLKAAIPQGTSSYISLVTNNEEMRVVGLLEVGETLVIDSGLVTAKVIDDEGVTIRNGLPLLQELNFPVLKKGANAITVDAVGATFTELQIQAKSRWR